MGVSSNFSGTLQAADKNTVVLEIYLFLKSTFSSFALNSGNLMSLKEPKLKSNWTNKQKNKPQFLS